VWERSPRGHVEEVSCLRLEILALQERLELPLRIFSTLRSDGGILEAEASVQIRIDVPEEDKSRVHWKSFCGRKNVTYWMGTIRETHDVGEVTQQGNEHTDPVAPLHQTD